MDGSNSGSFSPYFLQSWNPDSNDSLWTTPTGISPPNLSNTPIKAFESPLLPPLSKNNLSNALSADSGCADTTVNFTHIEDNALYEETLKQMTKFINPLSQLIEKEPDLPKTRKLLNTLQDINQKIPFQALKKSEEVLNKVFGQPKPAKIEGVEIEKDGEQRIRVSWEKMPQSGITYCVQTWCMGEITDGPVFGINNNNFIISSPDPTKRYSVDVWAQNEAGICGEKTRSENIMICQELGPVLINEYKCLRPDYEVFEGFLFGGSPSKEKVAVKIMHGPGRKNLHREIDNMKKLIAHQNTVLYRNSGRIQGIGNRSYIVMELCENGTLYELREKQQLDWKIVLLHIMHGLLHIHENGILHRDLKPQNILRSLDKKYIKIADFGLSKEKDPEKSKISKSASEIGTDGWGSPEHYSPAKMMSFESDIYSAGLVSYFTLSNGKHPFGTEQHRWKSRIIDGTSPDLSGLTCPDAEIAKDLILKMLNRKPENRPTAHEVLLHPYFWDGRKRLLFLHAVNEFLCPYILPKSKKQPESITIKIMDKVSKNTSAISTKNGEKNWFKKMEEVYEIKEKYNYLLLKADGKVLPKVKYNHNCQIHLLRYIRNICLHYREEKSLSKRIKGDDDLWNIFYRIFPKFFCMWYNVISNDWHSLCKSVDFPVDAFEPFKELAPNKPLPLTESRKRKRARALSPDLKFCEDPTTSDS